MDQHDLAAGQFGARAAQYLTSSVHASGADLDRLTALAKRLRVANALDLGCGAGHASYAVARADAARVVAYDLAPQMLGVVAEQAAARGHAQIVTCAGPAEHLEFADASFDLVVTRYSAHHWLDVRQALREVARTLTPGGTFVVIDVLAPESPLLDTVLQTIELLRDVSHVRDYRESEWGAMLHAANMAVSHADRWKLAMGFDSWVARIGATQTRIDALNDVFAFLPAEAREYFEVTGDNAFRIDSGWFEARKI